MNAIHLFRLFNKNLKIFVLCSVLLGGLVYFLTINSPSQYQSETEIFTGLASGVNVVDVEKTTVDYFSTANAFDNLINVIRSRQTLEEVGERLLAQHLALGLGDGKSLTVESYAELQELLPMEEMEALRGDGNVDSIYRRIQLYKIQYPTADRTERLFFSPQSPYSYQAISGIEVYRVSNSDLIRINYRWKDPGICQQTLGILNKVFTRKMSDIKLGQSNDVVEYFRQETAAALKKLQDGEERLKIFDAENAIMNHEEQTKSFVVMKEAVESEYQKELQARSSAMASLRKLESNLSLNKEILKFGTEIVQQKKKLADLNSKIASMEVYSQNRKELDELRMQATELKAQLETESLKRYQYSRTKEGVDIKDLLAEWLQQSLAVDEADARIEVIEKRKKYFNQVYEEFSPLGSKRNQMLREIEIDEKNYLELLHSMNQAILKQKSEALTSGGLVVTVPPYYPLSPQKSKRLMLVLAGLVLGFFLPLGIVFAADFFDQSLRKASRVEELTGLSMLGVYPIINSRIGKKERVDLNALATRSISMIVQNVQLAMKGISGRTKYVVVFGTEPGEGAGRISHELANELANQQERVEIWRAKPFEMEGERAYQECVFRPDSRFYSAVDFSSIRLEPTTSAQGSPDWVLLNLPPLLESRLPVKLLEKVDLSIVIFRASRVLRKADENVLDVYLQSVENPPMFVLNGCMPEDMEEVVGEIHKQRSSLRRFLKRVLRSEFSTTGGFGK